MKKPILTSLFILLTISVFPQTEITKPPLLPKDRYGNIIQPQNGYFNPDNGKYFWEKKNITFTPDTLTQGDSLAYFWFNHESTIGKFGLTDTGLTTAAAVVDSFMLSVYDSLTNTYTPTACYDEQSGNLIPGSTNIVPGSGTTKWYQVYPYFPGKIRIRRTNVANLTTKSIIQARGHR